MKKIIIYICLLLPVVAFQSCKKEFSPGDNYGVSESLPAYINIRTTPLTVKQGATATFAFTLRTSFQAPVTVVYSVSGAVNLANQTATIPRDAVTANGSFVVPANTIVPPATTATATVTLVSATTADGTKLTIGQNNVAANQKFTLNITL
jgi:hypothetical protein